MLTLLTFSYFNIHNVNAYISYMLIHSAMDTLAKSCVVIQCIFHGSRIPNDFFKDKSMLFLPKISFPTPRDMYILLKTP